MKVFSYARVSTDKQATVPDQLRQCRAHAAKLGWTIEAEFTDDGISGASTGNRPGIKAALEALKAAKGGVLLTTNIDRLSRSQELPQVIERIRFAGGRVVDVETNFDSANEEVSDMQAGMSATMSTALRRSIRVRVRAALKLRRRTGGPQAGRLTASSPRNASAQSTRAPPRSLSAFTANSITGTAPDV